MNYKKIDLSDIEIIRPYLHYARTLCCDYTIGGIFMSRDFFQMEYAIDDNILYIRLYDNDKLYYNLPLGENIEKGIKRLLEEDKNIDFCFIPEEYVSQFEKISKEKNIQIKIEQQEKYSDYIYDKNDLTFLKGKKYSGQRNMIHQFLREYPSWNYVEITSNDRQKLKEFLSKHYHVDENATKAEIEEERKVIEVLDNFDKYNFYGSMLTVNNEIVGFSLGEDLNGVLFEHVEKADKSIKGAYQMLVNGFASRYNSRCDNFINREDDGDDIGLKTSKLSYHPVKLTKKYIISFR